MNESISYYAGFAVGILVVLAVCIALKRKMLHSGKTLPITLSASRHSGASPTATPI